MRLHKPGKTISNRSETSHLVSDCLTLMVVNDGDLTMEIKNRISSGPDILKFRVNKRYAPF